MTQDKEGSLDAPRPVRHNKFDGLYETPEFMIWCYKVLPCAKVTGSRRLRLAGPNQHT